MFKNNINRPPKAEVTGSNPVGCAKTFSSPSASSKIRTCAVERYVVPLT